MNSAIVAAAPSYWTIGCEHLNRLAAFVKGLDPSTNKHDRVTVAISALVDAGVRTRPRILHYLKHLGFNSRHGAIILNAGTGSDPASNLWTRGDDGLYINNR